MTKLTPDKAIARETAENVQARPLAVRLHPRYLEIWRKGTRQAYRVAYDVIFDLARKRGVPHVKGYCGW